MQEYYANRVARQLRECLHSALVENCDDEFPIEFFRLLLHLNRTTHHLPGVSKNF
jgi:hypothetical protein